MGIAGVALLSFSLSASGCRGTVGPAVEAVLAPRLASALLYASKMRIADAALLTLSFISSGMGIAEAAYFSLVSLRIGIVDGVAIRDEDASSNVVAIREEDASSDAVAIRDEDASSDVVAIRDEDVSSDAVAIRDVVDSSSNLLLSF